MGIRGLTTYIAENEKQYLKPHDLCNCYLVIDGLSLVCNLYNTMLKSDSAFGGDYDEYYKVVKSFFLMLGKCSVTPIVLIDGGLEKRKIKTVLSRFEEKVRILRAFSKGYCRATFFPLFMTQTFVDVLEDLEIIYVQCDLEADDEIAAVARALNCPVLSNDSDFYIFGVLYIPFSSLQMKAEKLPNSNNHYVRCSIYDVNNLLQRFPGLDKSMLPIIATLLGNDYIGSSVFQKFFNHVIMPKNKNLSYTQRKIDGVFHWMKKENVESAVQLILTHLENRKAGLFLKEIRTSMEHYTSSFVSESVLDKLITRVGEISLNKKRTTLGLPHETLQLYYRGKIHSVVIDMINLGIYASALQVEDVHSPSPHLPSLQLIKDIYKMITPYKKHKQRYLNLYLNIRNYYGGARIEDTFSDCLTNFCLGDILKKSKEVRLKLLCQIVGVNESELSIVSSNNWSLFIIAYIYWVRKLNSQISFAHVHALILMAIANEAVQKHVGYYRTGAKFTKSKGTLLESVKNSTVTPGTSEDFEGMLKDLTLCERLLVSNALLPYRRTDGLVWDKVYCLATVHLFACFQSCLYHIMQVNALLNYPLPHLKVSDFYSGSLLFNLYLAIKSKPPLEKFVSKLFQGAPNLRRIYDHLRDCLCKYSEKPVSQVKKGKRRKKQQTPKEELVLMPLEPSEEYDEEYNDENNVYAVLSTLTKDE